jgi:hypothetical protein
MSQCPRPVPVGILVSVSGPPRRRRASIDKFPSIRKEVNLPLRAGIGVGVALSVLVALTSLVAYGVNRRAPVHVVAQVRNDAVVTKAPAPAPVAMPVEIAEVEPSAPPPAPRFAAPTFDAEPTPPQEVPAAPAVRPLAHPVLPAANAAPACSNHGTAVTFFENPPDAFRQAARENKLVLMVHLSGNFEDPAFT